MILHLIGFADRWQGHLEPDGGTLTSFVELNGVDLTYGGAGGTLAVQGLDLKVERGEFAAVVGPSGCGKSTLMKLTTGLVKPQVGEVLVAGRPVTGPVSNAGMAFQNPSLLPWRTTLRNVMLPLEIVQPHRSQLAKQRSSYEAQAEALLELVGLQGFGAKYPWELSGGMQQRSNLCRALIHAPDLLMLDEPFGALDAFTREELWGVIRDLHQEKAFTIILVTHDLREAVYLADRVFVMSARPGRIIEERAIEFRRPRPIDLVYEPSFNSIVHELREHIAQARVTS